MSDYPNLSKWLKSEGYDNSEVILRTLAQHFKMLVDLSALEDICTVHHTSGSYWHFFTGLVQDLGGIYTDIEIIHRVYTTLNNAAAREYSNQLSTFFHNTFLLKTHPQAGQFDGHPSQDGYLEKMVTRTLGGGEEEQQKKEEQKEEPQQKKEQQWGRSRQKEEEQKKKEEKEKQQRKELSEHLRMLDMLRYAAYCNSTYSDGSYSSLQHNKVAVYHVADLLLIKNQNAGVSSRYRLIDFNLKKNALPKWGVYDSVTNTVYCEVSLSEDEKSCLEKSLHNKRVIYEPNPSKANSSSSTGFFAANQLKKLIQAERKRISYSMGGAEDAHVEQVFFGLRESFLYDIGHVTQKGYNFYDDVDSNAPRVTDYQYFCGKVREEAEKRHARFKDVEEHFESSVDLPQGKQYLSEDNGAAIDLLAMLGRNDSINETAGQFKGNEPDDSIYNKVAIVAGIGIPYLDEFMRKKGFLTRESGYSEEVCLNLNFADNKIKNNISFLENFAEFLPDEHKNIFSLILSTVNMRWGKDSWDTVSDILRDFIQNGELDKKNHGNDVPTKPELDGLMILAVLYFQKNKHIVINLEGEKFQVPLTHTDWIVKLTDQLNPYLIELNCDKREPPPSFTRFQNKMLPILNRNAWLQSKGYKPPFMDNFWQVAAQYWMNHYCEQGDILNDDPENQGFRQSLAKTGIKGFDALIGYLQSHAEVIEKQLGKKQLTFFIPTVKKEINHFYSNRVFTEHSIRRICEHVSNGEYFPFNQVAISCDYDERRHCDLESDDFIANVFKPLFSIKKFEKILLVDVLKADTGEMVDLLCKLAEYAYNENIQQFIAIPELDGKPKLTPEDDILAILALADEIELAPEKKPLLNLYRHLNNIIANNRRQAKGELQQKKLANKKSYSKKRLLQKKLRCEEVEKKKLRKKKVTNLVTENYSKNKN
jgi:hypothetical protein